MQKADASSRNIGSEEQKRSRCKFKKDNKVSEMCQNRGGHLPTSSGQIRIIQTSDEYHFIRKNRTKASAASIHNNKRLHLRGRVKRPCQLRLEPSKFDSNHTHDVALNCSPATTTAINSPSSTCRLHDSIDRCLCGVIITTAADDTMHDQSNHYRMEFLSCTESPATKISHGLVLPVMDEEFPMTLRYMYRPGIVATIKDQNHKRGNRCHGLKPLSISKIDYINHSSLVKRMIWTLLIGVLFALPQYGMRDHHTEAFAQQLPSDPRPTIYSGQVSFGLLLSAHSSLGSEMSTSASHQFNSLLAINTSPNYRLRSEASHETLMKPRLAHEVRNVSGDTSTRAMDLVAEASAEHKIVYKRHTNSKDQGSRNGPGDDYDGDEYEDDDDDGHKSRKTEVPQATPTRHRHHRQIFDRSHFRNLQQKQQQQMQRHRQRTPANQSSISSSTGKSTNSDAAIGGMVLSNGCNQINPSALYAGMGAVWASHQANLVGDSPLTIGTYVYDSCNDLDVGQRQAVRIVSNLNAFQQTTCEAPRGSPISLTIAHGDQQLRAIQLLTSFKVPVITTKEHFALEDYNQLTRDQKRFLFSTAPSSRHLALGALRFARRVVSRTIVSPKLPNQFHKMSSKNGLIVISRNLPARFISFLVEVIPNHVNYEILQSSQPIDQVRSIESVESIMGSRGGFTSGSSLVPVDAGPLSLQPDRTMDLIVQNESRQNRTFLQNTIRSKRAYLHPSDDNTDSSSSSDSIGSSGSPGTGDSDGTSDGSSGSSSSTRMLSPTILMFITPAEAIDLVTRLRNDLAEVSQYYSLIVSTREDISPALKTIFHRGGSRLCSGKSFYTISPKPDDIGEFSRYFRDTIQMEGESSDHPLITEFAKYQSTSKISADLDDISTEPVIKAVWAAAAAFKLVHRRECGSTSSNESSNTDANISQVSPKRQANGGSNGGQKSAQQECLVKMNKNMSILVQRTLKRLDVYINSTGLQAFDGFRIKFDELNELMTNSFSIKYINKECELTEIGEYSGFKDSQLLMDEELLHKSLESALPDPWPMPATTKGPTSSSAGSGGGESSTPSSVDSTGSAATEGENGSDSGLTGSGSPGDKNDVSASEEASSSRHQDGTVGDRYIDPNDADAAVSAALRRQAKRSKNLPHDQAVTVNPRGIQVKKKSTTKKAAPVTTVSGQRGMLPGVTDTTDAPYSTTTTRNQDDEAIIRALRSSLSSNGPTTVAQQKVMRRLKPFPTNNGTTLYDWIPKTDPPTTTTFNGLLYDRQPDDKEQVDGDSADFMAKASTTRPPAHSTLPESGGNTDLDSTPAVKPIRNNNTNSNSLTTAELSSKSDSQSRSTLDTAASTTESSDYITIVPDIQHRTSTPHSAQYRSPNHDLPDQTLAPMLATSTPSTYNNELPTIRINNHMRDLNTSPVPLSTMTPSYSSASANPTGIYATYVDQSTGQSINERFAAASTSTNQNIDLKLVKSRLRWTYSSWFAMLILGANVCGALLTLYVLTFLLMKNCDGSLSRENQTIRSMYLLAIIIMLFGSTLFIAYPTPGLCLLRTSWHNFALVMIFGSLLLQTMQTRSLDSLGLGGRANRLNQFLTLVFIVAVQVSFELQRWRYESTNYVNFINQYLGPSMTTDYNIMAVSSFMNPLNTLNDQIRPVSIEISERYQTLLHDCCTQHDLIQSQFYLWFVLCLLVIFNITIRREGFLKNSSHHRVKSRADALSVFSVTLICVPIYCVSIILHVHGQNIINRDIVSSLTLVAIAFITLIGIFIPIMRQMHRREGQALISKLSPTSSASSTSTNHNQSSATATTSSTSSGGHKPINSGNANLIISGGAPIDVTAAPITTKASSSQTKFMHQHRHNNINGVFTMFPEFAQTGLRRPASLSGDSLLAGHNTRHRFKETKESRRQMGVALANLSPSADSLRGIGLMNPNVSNIHDRHSVIKDKQLGHNKEHHIDHALLNLKLNLVPQPKDMQGVADDNNIDHEVSLSPDIANVDLYKGSSTHRAAPHENIAVCNQRRHHDRSSQQYDRKHHIDHDTHRRSTNDNIVGCGTERRLVMLDVDPFCPRHGAMKGNGNNNHSHRHEHQ